MADDPKDALRDDVSWLRAVSEQLARSEEAEDVAQDAWLAAQRSDAPGGAGRRPWLRVVTRNFARMARRRRMAAEASRARLRGSDDSVPADTHLHRSRVMEAVRDAMDGLSDADRDILVRRFMHDQDVAEIATALDLQPGAVRTRVSRALARVRDRLDDKYGGREAWANALIVASLRPAAAPRRVIPWIGLALSSAALVGTWLLLRDPVPGPEPTETAPALAAAASTDARDAPAVEPPVAGARPTAPTSGPDHASTPPPRTTPAGADPGRARTPPRATAVQASLKAIGTELAELSAECFAEVPAGGDGVMRFSLHIRAAADIGAVVDEVSVSSDTTDLADLKDCLEGSIPAFHLAAVEAELDQMLDFKVDLGRRKMYVHTELVVDDIDAYMSQQREMGIPEHLVTRLREQLEKSPATRTGVALPLDPEEARP